MLSANPYKPPAAVTTEASPNSRPRSFASLIPASLSLGLTLVAWVVLVSSLTRLVERSFSMPLWSATLFLASTLSIVAVNRVWRSATHALAFGFVFALFCVVFLIAEGDTSNGTNYWNMAFVYGTLLTLPFASYLVARCSSQATPGGDGRQDAGG